MQTILGSGGAIGVELAKSLQSYSPRLRLVSRNPRPVNPDDEPVAADLTIFEEVSMAVKGSEIVYVTVGFPYKTTVWEVMWPILVRNVIEACKTHNAKLVFFDNCYMYDRNCLSPMTEDTAIRPTSRKGMIRAKIAGMIMEEVQKGNLQALIARCADFYGPAIKNASVLTEMVFRRYAEGKKANWLGSVEFRHAFTYTPDAAAGTAMLGNSPDCYNQVWHLPTRENPPTGRQWIEAIAKTMGVAPAYRVATRLMVRMLGLFIPIMRELGEMMYQYDRDYVFDSSKFRSRFSFKPMPYGEGIEEIAAVDHRRSNLQKNN